MGLTPGGTGMRVSHRVEVSAFCDVGLVRAGAWPRGPSRRRLLGWSTGISPVGRCARNQVSGAEIGGADDGAASDGRSDGSGHGGPDAAAVHRGETAPAAPAAVRPRRCSGLRPLARVRPEVLAVCRRSATPWRTGGRSPRLRARVRHGVADLRPRTVAAWTEKGRRSAAPVARSGAACRRRSRCCFAPCGVRVRARHGRKPVGQRVRDEGSGSSDLRAVQADQGTPAYGTDLGAPDEHPPPARPTGPLPCAYNPHPAEPSVRDKTPHPAQTPIRQRCRHGIGHRGASDARGFSRMRVRAPRPPARAGPRPPGPAPPAAGAGRRRRPRGPRCRA